MVYRVIGKKVVGNGWSLLLEDGYGETHLAFGNITPLTVRGVIPYPRSNWLGETGDYGAIDLDNPILTLQVLFPGAG